MSGAPEQEVLLEICGLSKNFGGVVAVSDVTMDLRAGIVTTLVGPNGAGKTTHFNLITGHLGRTAGTVRWLGRDSGGRKPYRVARLGIGRTFQDLRLFGGMSVEENILTVMEPGALPFSGPRMAQKRARAAEVMERTGLAGKRHERAADLAYAERKFLSLARIMAAGARL